MLLEPAPGPSRRLVVGLRLPRGARSPQRPLRAQGPLAVADRQAVAPARSRHLHGRRGHVLTLSPPVRPTAAARTRTEFSLPLTAFPPVVFPLPLLLSSFCRVVVDPLLPVVSRVVLRPLLQVHRLRRVLRRRSPDSMTDSRPARRDAAVRRRGAAADRSHRWRLRHPCSTRCSSPPFAVEVPPAASASPVVFTAPMASPPRPPRCRRGVRRRRRRVRAAGLRPTRRSAVGRAAGRGTRSPTACRGR